MKLQDLLTTPIVKDPTRELAAFLREGLPPFATPADINVWKRQASARRKAARAIYLRGIPQAVVQAKPRVVWGEVLQPDPAYVIRKLRYEIYPNYWIPGLLYEPTDLRGKVPVVLNPNGHHRGGKAADYKQIRCANIARRGMIALNMEYIGMAELEADCDHNNIAHLEITGIAGVGMFYLALQKGLDVLLAHRHGDPARVGVTGLSGGGWQTIVISALDERVTLAVPVAGYTPLRARIACDEDLGDKEQCPADQVAAADYDTLTALLAPRPALLILNENDDCCFQTARTRPLIYDAIRPTYQALGVADKFKFYSNLVPGTHNYEADNRSQFYAFTREHFALPADTPIHDLHRPDEFFTERELEVGLPANQQTMMGIARERALQLGLAHTMPRTPAARRALRRKLAQVLKVPTYEARGRRVAQLQDGSAAQFALRAGAFTLPLFYRAGEAKAVPVLSVNPGGRTEPLPIPPADPGPHYHLEMVGTGELRTKPFRLSLVESAGQRLLGIQAAQIIAAARWVTNREKAKQVHLIGDGWSCCLALLMAAALEPALFASYTNYATFRTLRYLMDWPVKYTEEPAVFCFGLLEVADIPQIEALLEGVEYRNPGRGVIAE